MASLLSFTLGALVFEKIFTKFPWWQKFSILTEEKFSENKLKAVLYILFGISLVALKLFYDRAGNFPLFAPNPDEFRFIADEQVPGLINYTAQFARIFIPLGFFLIFIEGFNLKKHWDICLMMFLGVISLILFTSRTQIFFVDLWVMALFLFMRKPNLKQALKFYPIFLAISVIVLAVVPLYRQNKSYGENYLGGITGINTESYNKAQKALLPIYLGVSFNQQALLHAQEYYEKNPIQKGKVTLDPFTNILGLEQYKSSFDLGEIFYSWWNTGTYLFPFVQDFGDTAFFVIPFFVAGVLVLVWRYWLSNPNFLSINLYAYAVFFVVMTVYLSFTVRAEMYLDLFLLVVLYFILRSKEVKAKLKSPKA